MMHESEYSVSLSLIIRACDMQTVSSVIGRQPTQVFLKGKKVLKCLPLADENVWVYTKTYPQEQQLDKILENFIMDCGINGNGGNALQEIGDCCLRLSIQSDYAQIGFKISCDSIRLIEQTGIDFEVSVFSWGKVIDEG